MKKIGQIEDRVLIKRANARGPKATKVVNNHVKAKVAMVAMILDAGERKSGMVLKTAVKKALVKEAGAYIPTRFMAIKGEADNVFKYAEAVLTKLVTVGVKRKGASLYDIEATYNNLQRKVAADAELDIPEQKPESEMDPAQGSLVEEQLVDKVYDELGTAEQAKKVRDGDTQGAGSVLDAMAQVNTALTEPNLSSPNPASAEKQASAVFARINNLLSRVETTGSFKKTAQEVADATPVNNPSVTGTAAEEADKEAKKDVDGNPVISKEVVVDAGKDMDLVAMNSDLELIFQEDGNNDGNVGPLDAPKPIVSADSTAKVTTADKGKKVTASADIFSDYITAMISK